jgi:hypothetical protein
MKWLNLPSLKSLSLFLLLCTPKNAAATLLTVLMNDEFLLRIFYITDKRQISGNYNAITGLNLYPLQLKVFILGSLSN